jgi:hypothetical protein
MEEFHQTRVNKHRKVDLHICIMEMQTHKRKTDLKEEEELK